MDEVAKASRLIREPAAFCAKPISRPRNMRLSGEPAEENNRLSRRKKCGLITEKFISTVFNICRLFATWYIRRCSIPNQCLIDSLLFLERGQFAWVYGALQYLTQHYGTRCRYTYRT